MSALPLGGGGDLFHKGGSALGSFQYTQKESRSSYAMDSKKKRKAPQPPAGLQQYKPKILSSDSITNVPVQRHEQSPVPPPRPSKNRGVGNTTGVSDVSGSKAILMGDKDVPMVFPGTEDDPEDIDLNVSQLNLASHDLLNKGRDGGTDNPLFHMQDENLPSSLSSDNPLLNTHDESTTAPQSSDNPLFNTHDESSTAPQSSDNPLFHMNNESTVVEQSTDNPLFNMYDDNTTSPQPSEDSVITFQEESPTVLAEPQSNPQKESYSSPQFRSDPDHGSTEQKEKTEPEGVYIPAPDYEEEEVMMAIAEEPDDNQRRSTKVFKEYAGEDFGQYLSDEENGSEEILRRASRPNHQLDYKSKTEVKRPHYRKREPLPSKNKKDKGVSGYSSLRNFSYADSKFGTIKGQSKKAPEMVSTRSERTKEAEIFVNTGASYEQFLYGKNGEDPRLPDMDPGSRHSASSGYAGQVHNRDSVWKRLTWRMKKHVNSFDLTASS